MGSLVVWWLSGWGGSGRRGFGGDGDEAGDDGGAAEGGEAEGAADGFGTGGQGAALEHAVDDHRQGELLVRGVAAPGNVGEGLVDLRVAEEGPGAGVLLEFLLGAEEDRGDGVDGLRGRIVDDHGEAGDAAEFGGEARPDRAVGHEAEGDDDVEGVVGEGQVHHVADDELRGAGIHDGTDAVLAGFVAGEDGDGVPGGGERDGELSVAAADVEDGGAGVGAEEALGEALLDVEHPLAGGAGEAPGVLVGGGVDVRGFGEGAGGVGFAHGGREDSRGRAGGEAEKTGLRLRGASELFSRAMTDANRIPLFPVPQPSESKGFEKTVHGCPLHAGRPAVGPYQPPGHLPGMAFGQGDKQLRCAPLAAVLF